MRKRVSGRGHTTQPLRAKNYCFACGPDNAGGMHLKFVPDREGKGFVSNFRLGKRYTGPPRHCHGGIIATILDDAMSKLSKFRGVVAVTAEMTINYLKPVPLHTPLRVASREMSKRGRRLIRIAEIVNGKGTVLASGRGTFVIVDPTRVFKRK
jgi:uncharacterized protein (TIGR00369 family)